VATHRRKETTGNEFFFGGGTEVERIMTSISIPFNYSKRADTYNIAPFLSSLMQLILFVFIILGFVGFFFGLTKLLKDAELNTWLDLHLIIALNCRGAKYSGIRQ
jgi:hypothetical protein